MIMTQTSVCVHACMFMYASVQYVHVHKFSTNFLSKIQSVNIHTHKQSVQVHAVLCVLENTTGTHTHTHTHTHTQAMMFDP